jgi:hypothetical protein
VIRNIKEDTVDLIRTTSVTSGFSDVGICQDSPLAPSAESARSSAFLFLDSISFGRFIESDAFRAIENVPERISSDFGTQISGLDYVSLWAVDGGEYLSKILYPQGEIIELVPNRSEVADLLNTDWLMDRDVTYLELAIIKASANLPFGMSWDEIRCEEFAFAVARSRDFDFWDIEEDDGFIKVMDIGAWREFCKPDEALSWTLKTYDAVDYDERFAALSLARDHSFDTCTPYFDARVGDYELISRSIEQGIDPALAKSMSRR